MSQESGKQRDQTDKRTGDSVSDTDTASYRQPWGGTQDQPERRNPRMPHERDESARSTGERSTENPVPSDRQISDAQADVEQGRVDTDRRGVPNDVPGGTTRRPN